MASRAAGPPAVPVEDAAPRLVESSAQPSDASERRPAAARAAIVRSALQRSPGPCTLVHNGHPAGLLRAEPAHPPRSNMWGTAPPGALPHPAAELRRSRIERTEQHEMLPPRWSAGHAIARSLLCWTGRRGRSLWPHRVCHSAFLSPSPLLLTAAAKTKTFSGSSSPASVRSSSLRELFAAR